MYKHIMNNFKYSDYNLKIKYLVQLYLPRNLEYLFILLEFDGL